MPYIYKIINLLNQKIYIGKTSQSIKQRWETHCKDRSRFTDRPLYRALNKYGIENFSIEEIECVENDAIAQERERYWIEYFGSFKYGYNATIGGDGRSYIDYSLVKSLYEKLGTCQAVAIQMNISNDSVSRILKTLNIQVLSGQEHGKLQNQKLVGMYSLNNTLLQSFSSMNDAARYLIEHEQANGAIEGIRAHIRQVCQNKRKTAYKYIWRWL